MHIREAVLIEEKAMPTYDYRCDGCGHRFESFRPMTDPEASCPICGKPAERLISAGAGFLFKGSGFYITDYRSAEYRNKKQLERNPSVEKTSP